MKTCLKCGSEFETENDRRLYCSRKCYADAKAMRHYQRYGEMGAKRKDVHFVCKHCQSSYKPKRRDSKYCSSACSAAFRKKYLSIPQCLEEASRKLDKTIGYVRVYCPLHPKANTWGYVYEHRLIMESVLGRHLVEKEHIHHINGKRWDNRPENLQLCTASEHSKITAQNQ